MMLVQHLSEDWLKLASVDKSVVMAGYHHLLRVDRPVVHPQEATRHFQG